MDLNLNDVDVAAGEAGEPEPKTVTHKDETYRLVDDLPILDLKGLFADLASLEEVVKTEDVAAIIDIVNRVLPVFFVEGEFERFRRTKPGIRAVMRLATGIPDLYGFGGLGESSASSDSSSTTGDGSKPTSDGSTGSTPEPPSSDPVGSAVAT